MVARGYGGNGYSAKTVEEITEAFVELKKSEVSSIVDIKTLPGTMTDGYNAWWRVGTAQVSAHPSVEAAAKDIQEHVAKSRMY